MSAANTPPVQPTPAQPENGKRGMVIAVLVVLGVVLTTVAVLNIPGGAAYAAVPDEPPFIRFEWKERALTPGDIPTIERVSRILESNPDCDLMVQGSHDYSQSAYNAQLASDRATNALNHLVDELGVDASRLSTSIITVPVAHENDPAARRALFRFECPPER